MTCLYSQTDTDSRCKHEVERLREDIMRQSISNGGSYSQYVNTPTCQDASWAERYFGFENYQKLLVLKKLWDPDNVLHYCQSIGSSNYECC